MRRLKGATAKGRRALAVICENPELDSYAVADLAGCSPSLVRYYRLLRGERRLAGYPKGRKNEAKNI